MEDEHESSQLQIACRSRFTQRSQERQTLLPCRGLYHLYHLRRVQSTTRGDAGQRVGDEQAIGIKAYKKLPPAHGTAVQGVLLDVLALL